MTTKIGLMLALTAGTVVPGMALAQVDDTCNLPARAVTPDMFRGGSYAGHSYNSRVNSTVFNVGIPAVSGGDWRSSGTNTYDDVTFPASAFLNNTNPAGTIHVNGINLGFIIPNPADATNDHLYTKVSFFPDHNNAVAATVQPYSGTAVVWNLDWGAGWSGGAGFIEYYPDPVTFGGAGITLDATNVFNGGAGDRTCGVYIETFLDAALTVYATTGATQGAYQVVRRGLWTAPAVGSTDYFGWFDGTASATSYDILNGNRSGGTLATSRATFQGFQGDGFTPPAPPATALGCITDAGLNVNGTVGTDGVTWYTFCVNSAADLANLKFMDIDSEGSAADVMAVVFDSTGNGGGYAYDRDSGSAGAFQLSFGTGRRTGPNSQYDGRHYMSGSGIPAGTYYLAVMPNASSFLNNGWGVTGSGAGGNFSLHFRTNNNSGALAASVAPALAAGDDLDAAGQIINPGAQIAGAALAAHQVRWLKFSTCKDTNASDTVTLTLAGSSSPGASSAMTLFNDSGNMITQSISAGAPPAADLVFNDTNPLARGTYYLALSYNGFNFTPSPGTNGRWCEQSLSGNNGFNFAGAVLVSWTACCHGDCVADFDDGSGTGTPDQGVTIDDLLYYLQLFSQGALCADVDDGSGTGTQDQGVTIDDLLYFLFRFSQGC